MRGTSEIDPSTPLRDRLKVEMLFRYSGFVLAKDQNHEKPKKQFLRICENTKNRNREIAISMRVLTISD